MKLYNATVRLDGSITNEVVKNKLTAAEIAVLQRIHGEDAVQKVVEVGSVKNRSDASERKRLMNEYTGGPTADHKGRLEGETFMASIFGISGVPLPHAYAPAPIVDEDETEEMNAVEEIEEISELPQPVRITRTRVDKPAAQPATEIAAELTA